MSTHLREAWRSLHTADILQDDPAGNEQAMWAEWRRLIAKHELSDWDLTVGKTTTGPRAAGTTNFAEQRVYIAPWSIQQLPLEKLIDTLRHEVAHILAGAGAGHGLFWKARCYEVGANPDATFEDAEVDPGYKWIGVCPEHGNSGGGWFRKPSRAYICSTCRQRLDYVKVGSLRMCAVIGGTSRTALTLPTFYHGTGARLSTGDVLVPGHPRNFSEVAYPHQGMVFLTDKLDTAFFYAVLGQLASQNFGKAYVYQVEAPDAWIMGGLEWVAPAATIVGDVTSAAIESMKQVWQYSWARDVERQKGPIPLYVIKSTFRNYLGRDVVP